MFYLENEWLKVDFQTLGGEMSAMYDKEKNIQVLYQGNEGWQGKNPSLFPIIGNTYSKTYEINGQTYAMKNHGLVRYANLEVVHQTENQITFRLESNVESKKQYPFDFCFDLTYTLEEKCITISYVITNNSHTSMPFSFGLHPAFRVPLFENENFEDYKIIYEKPQLVEQIIVENEKLVYQEVALSEWQLSYDEIKEHATILYRNVQQEYIDLQGPSYALRLTCKGYPYLALWNDQTSNYICIEPWMGISDLVDPQVSFENREGTMHLAPNECKEFMYSIELR